MSVLEQLKQDCRIKELDTLLEIIEYIREYEEEFTELEEINKSIVQILSL